MSDSECLFTLSPCNSTVMSSWQLVILVSSVTEVKKQLLSMVNIKTADGEKVRLGRHTNNTLYLKLPQRLVHTQDGVWDENRGYWRSLNLVIEQALCSRAAPGLLPNGEFFLALIQGCYKVLWHVYVHLWVRFSAVQIKYDWLIGWFGSVMLILPFGLLSCPCMKWDLAALTSIDSFQGVSQPK